ncbi:hypothetical protein Clacol_002950 [Clathrus columnatus]|uniref:Uncharacterized protein n=1 Tax=Clathrus columnatus TaxID=1419009 RepID=A0AAV5A244_9AGAM|nr:hypothetical protein Clacol_002950 [Clathrus columnatus]
MAAPTQVFPPWLTPVPVTTEVNGIQEVETSIEFIPLTYFGPSIPLGSVFTFGGSTFPPTVEFGPQSTSTSAPVSTSSSSPTSTSQSSTASPSTSATSASTTASSTQATSSATQSPQPVAASVNSHGLSTATKLAIGLSIGIVFFLLLCLLAVFLRVRRRRALRSINRFSDSDWQIVGSPDVNQDAAGETDEAEVLLPEERVMRQRASLSSTPALTPWMRTAYEPVASAAVDSVPRNSQNSARSAGAETWSTSQPTGSRSTIAPSSLFFNPAKSRAEGAKQTEEKTTTSRDGSSLTGEPSSSPSDGDRNYAVLPAGASPPLFPPRSYRNYQVPALDDDEFVPPAALFTSPPRSRSRHHSTDSLPYPESPPSETDERATLLTAQRVDLGPQVTATSISPQARSRSLSPEERPESFGLGTSLAGLTRLTGLNRFSWFRRMENRPTGYRHSSPPLSPTDDLHRTSSFNRLSFHPGSRPHSGILYPGYISRPMSDISYSGLADNELGLRPPTMHISTGGSSGSYSRSGNGSGSGRTTYHSALSRPGSFYPPPVPQLRSPLGEGVLIDVRDTFPGLDIAQDTIRPIDVLDMPVPEPTLPLQAALSPDNVVSRSSSRGSPHFPPGLVAVPRWNSATTSNPDVDVLDQAPPRSPGEWSSMKSKQASSGSPVERVADVEHDVEVTSAQGPMSEEGIIETGRSFSPDPPNALGFSLTPRVSLYAPSEHVSHNSGSHSSRPSDHTTFSRETHGSYNDPLSDDEYRPPGIQRASLSAIGGHVRRKSSTVAGRVLPAPEERISEEERSGGGSRPGSMASAGSRPTVSETVVSRTPTSGQAFDSIGKVGGQEVASIINVLQSSEQHSADNP